MSEQQLFYPPRLNSNVVRLVQWVTPALARWLYWFELDLSTTDQEKLEQLASQRVLLMPNHPTFHDPMVMFALSAQLQQSFHYLAALETFERTSTMFLIGPLLTPLRWLANAASFQKGLRWFFQSLGMYSIRRGLPDRQSVVQTLELLQQDACHLVIFPEGGCSFQNDQVMPFRTGGIDLAFRTLTRLAKQTPDPPDLIVQPIAIKYQYTQDMQPVIEACLNRLEHALDLTPTLGRDAYQRLRLISEAIVSRLEHEYGLSAATDRAIASVESSPTEATSVDALDSTTKSIKDMAPHDDVDTANHGIDLDAEQNASLNNRINALRQHVIAACEAQLNLPPSNDLVRERVYRLQHYLQRQQDSMHEAEPDAANNTERVELSWPPELITKTLSRLLNFDAIYDGYVRKLPTPERFLDTLIRLEREIFEIDQPPPKSFRQAKIMLGEPINLKDYLSAYQGDRATTVEQVVTQIQDSVQTQLDRYNELNQRASEYSELSASQP
ncbi:MAG: lysophospholipid acyltransferase family protein [Cyanobacteria bacterium P01_H01_bin.121]